MSKLRDFVSDRLSGHDLDHRVHQAYTTILDLSDTIRSQGKKDDWISWFTEASVEWKIGEYIFGADPASDAARVSDHLRATLARTWRDHPEYDTDWDALTAAPRRR